MASTSRTEPDIEKTALRLLQQVRKPVTQHALQQQLERATGQSVDLERMGKIINALLSRDLVAVGNNAQGDLMLQVRDQSEVKRVHGLGKEERLVLQLIEAKGSQGIWQRDIKSQSNLQNLVPTILKNLEDRKLVKRVRTPDSKHRMMYMLYDLAPQHRAFLTESMDLDTEFVNALRGRLEKWAIQRRATFTVAEAGAHIAESKISKVELRDQDIMLLLNSLVYDAKLERLRHDGPWTPDTGEKDARYRPLRSAGLPNGLAELPCNKCPLVDVCQEGHEVSPSSCEYFDAWLKTVDEW